MKMKRALLLTAVAACGSPPRGTSTAEPVGPASPPAVAPERISAAVVNRAPITMETDVDATSLGSTVQAVAFTRYGATSTSMPDAQLYDITLVLVGDGASLAIDLGHYEGAVERPQPFGELVPTAPFDGEPFFAGAPAWTIEAPVLLVQIVPAVLGDNGAYVVTREGDALVIRYAEDFSADGKPVAWDVSTTIALAPHATVTAPVASLETPEPDGPIVVDVIERPVYGSPDLQPYQLSLQIGERVGPLADTAVRLPEEHKWSIPAVMVIVPMPFPAADVYLAHREYTHSDTDYDMMLIGRVGDELVVWDRHDTSPADAPWIELLRVPLPAGATLDVGEPAELDRGAVEIIEHRDGELDHRRFYSITLWVDDRVGPVVNVEAEAGTERGWRSASIDHSLEEPWPAESIEAFCRYPTTMNTYELALGRSGGDVVLWQRNDVDTEWFEITRLPLDADTALDVKLPYGPIGTSPYKPDPHPSENGGHVSGP